MKNDSVPRFDGLYPCMEATIKVRQKGYKDKIPGGMR